MSALVISNLHKQFGDNKVLDGLSFTVEEGSIFGFIGQNGAGKTTTMKTILGFLKPDSGEILVCDKPVKYGKNSTNKLIGYLPDVPDFYGYMNALEYLTLCGDICGMKPKDIKSKSIELLEMVGLRNYKGKISGFSRGMKQRLGIAQALLSEPKILICDEPTSALDPAGRKEIIDILFSLKGKTTVIFSTHILSDVERICDTIAVLNKGKIALYGPLDEIRSHHKKNIIYMEFLNSNTAKAFADLLEKEQGIKGNINDRTITFETKNLEETELCIITTLSKNKILPTKLEIKEPTLENLFLEVIK